MSWFESFGTSLGPLANTLQVLAALMTGAVFMWGLLRKRQLRAQRIQVNLEQALEFRRLEVESLKEALRAQEHFDPRTWLERAQRERQDGNEAKAGAALREGLELVRDPLSASCAQLARFLVTLHPERGALPDAQRHARLAALLCPENRERAIWLDEINTAVAVSRSEAGESPEDPSGVRFGDDDDYYGQRAEDPAALLDMLNTQVQACSERGQDRIAERLAYRQRQIALRVFGDGHPATFLARRRWSLTLGVIGLREAALREIDEHLRVARESLPEEAQESIAGRIQRVELLGWMDRYDQGLAELGPIIEVAERALGPDHPESIRARVRKAHALRALSRSEEGLAEVAAALKWNEPKSLDPPFDMAHQVRAQLLIGLDRSAEAFDHLNEVMHLDHGLKADHPTVLAIRYLQARALQKLKRTQEALDACEALIPIQEQVLVPEHPQSAVETRVLRAELLNDLGRKEEALKEITSVLPTLDRVEGATRTRTIEARKLRADLLMHLQRAEEALEEMDTVLSAWRAGSIRAYRGLSLLILQHAHTLAQHHRGEKALQDVELLLARASQDGLFDFEIAVAQGTRVELLFSLGRGVEIRGKIDELLPDIERLLGPENPMAERLRRLRDGRTQPAMPQVTYRITLPAGGLETR